MQNLQHTYEEIFSEIKILLAELSNSDSYEDLINKENNLNLLYQKFSFLKISQKMDLSSGESEPLQIIDNESTKINSDLVSIQEFDDENKVPNISVRDIDGEILLVSQFTLHAETKKGNRPSYIRAAKPTIAIPLYQKMIDRLEIDLGKNIATGVFGADMKVELINDGPIKIFIDSKEKEYNRL